jgi:hypothetical protein
MKLSHQIRRLRRHRAISLHLAAGASVLVARGKAWLTAAGDPRDYVLCHGRNYTARKPEHLVLQAFDSTVVYAVR